TEHIDIWTAAQTQKTNSGRGRGKNSNGQSPHGIKKLRELIFDLAVRGKLVPQDPNDEPASVLIKKIAEERERLIKEGKIKKQKPLPEISEDEKPFELPAAWEWTRLGDVTNYGISEKAEPDDVVEDTWVLELGDVEKETSKLLEKVRFADREFRSSKNHFSEGDVIYGKLRPYLDKVIIADESGVCTTEMIPLRGYDNITPQYLRLVMKSPYFIRYANESTHGMNLPRMGTYKARLALFPVVSEAEQNRIVTKVDELMALCDQLEQQQTGSNATHQTLVETLLATLTNATDQGELEAAWQRNANHFDTLFTTEQSIDQLKQTILQLAVMGKLVPQDHTDLPAPQSGKFFVYALECEDKSIYIGQTNDILNRWKEHATGKGADWTNKHPPLRLVHWEEYNSREEAITREKELKTGFGRKWLKRELAAGRTRQAGEPASILLEKISAEKARLIKDGKIKKQKLLPEISEDEKPFELSGRWAWARYGELPFEAFTGIDKGKSLQSLDFKYPYFKMNNILNDGGFDLTDITCVDATSAELEKYSLENGDFLFNTRNSRELVGKTCVIRGLSNEHVLYNNNILRAKLPFVLPEFIDYWFRSVSGKLLLEEKKSSTTNVCAIYQGKLFEMLCVIPPIEEQHRIVAKVDELMAICNTLKARLNIAQTSQVQLADAIVEQAMV
ncbi:GIY-YIG nuclease family protein, partial [bacterium]|nr:GIY-YIG nuclease family protein [bacterium]